MDIITVEEVLDRTAVGCGYHQFNVGDGVMRFKTDELRPVLEEAFCCHAGLVTDWESMISWTEEDGWFIP